MTVMMNNRLDFPPRERAQHLLNKNVELENKRRKSSQARIPSDPNIWQQMRDNYESIILEDHHFSEKHEIEYSLWQLHYRRIDELRAHLNTAMSSSGAHGGQNGKLPIRPDRFTKIRSQFKAFLSEATGFYHDLMLKIRSKYGLPLGYFSNDPDNQSVFSKDGDMPTVINKGLVSCHRCLIYLGDLSRYKVLYGDGDSKTRDFSMASSYYTQAISLCPSSGNPHHQLAIMATYSGEDLIAIYRYFRSLAVECPFSTARDNLIIAFEKNRQSYSQIVVDVKNGSSKSASHRLVVKGRGKRDMNTPSKDRKSGFKKERKCSPAETFKIFSIRFVRLNGILFTRTSLETFGEVLHSVIEGLYELISYSTEGDCIFSSGAGDDRILIVWLVTILIFTVHNVGRESENQTYADILQRNVLLQHALTAIFEFMGCIIERYTQLNDIPDTLILPGVLVFVEWLACHPDIAAGDDVEEQQASARFSFWNHLVSLLNRIMETKVIHGKEQDGDSFFFSTTRHTEEETRTQLALFEDFELRGFVPLLPAQMILDFSRKLSVVCRVNQKEKITRIQRIIAAGKALSGSVKLGQHTLCFDEDGKFFVGTLPKFSNNFILRTDSTDINRLSDNHFTVDQGLSVPLVSQLVVEDEEEDEVIVFKPPLMDKPSAPVCNKTEALRNDFNVKIFSTSFSATDTATAESSAYLPFQQIQPIQQEFNTSELTDKPDDSIFRGLNMLKLHENVVDDKSVLRGCEMAEQGQFNFSQSVGFGSDVISDTIIPSKLDSVMVNENNTGIFPVNSLFMPTTLRKNPVQRPVRHFGPPPGFNSESVKQADCLFPGISKNENILLDDYSWLDGYQVPTRNGDGYDISDNNHHLSGNHLDTTGPFYDHGNNQSPSSLCQAGHNEGDDQVVNHSKLNEPSTVERGNHHFRALSGHYQRQYPWGNNFFV